MGRHHRLGGLRTYAGELAAPNRALAVWRHAEPRPRGGRARSKNGLAASRPCGRRIRVAPRVYEAGTIVRGLCGDPFTAPHPAGLDADPDR
ncbi:MAG: hypothetical protein ACRDN9_17075 [Streptosporangiaceae bacterium]